MITLNHDYLESFLISDCPLSDPKYSLVNGACMYFENIEMTRTAARSNCESKMARYGKGRLVEPRSLEMNEMVAQKAFDLMYVKDPLNGCSYFHIGVNDTEKPDTYVYESNLEPISFTPTWYDGVDHRPGNNKTRHQCTYVGSNKQFLDQWADHTSNWKYVLYCSICE